MDNDELLVKYLAGEANADESVQAEAWIETSAENRTYFEQFKQLWDESQKLAHNSSIDEDMAWNRFRERIQKEYIESQKPAANYQWLKVAAVILLIAGAALAVPYFFSRNEGVRDATAINSSQPPVTLLRSVTADNTRIDTLPDGSVVTLNRYSSIDYPQTFGSRTRDVQLNGEAFFSVRHIEGKPFVIKASGLLITVIGTSFNVDSRDGKTEVIVETGVVSVKKQASIVSLYPGEKVTVFNADTMLKKEPNRDTLYKSYVFKLRAYALKTAKATKTDTPFDINKHPELLKQILKDPKQWAKLLKSYSPQGENIEVRRAVIRSVLDELAKEKIAAKGTVISFRLNKNEFIINDKRQPDAVQRRFKEKFIKEPGYSVYFGGAPRNGRGIFLSPDSL